MTPLRVARAIARRASVAVIALAGVVACRDNAPDVTPAVVTIGVPAAGLGIPSGSSITLAATVTNAGGTPLFGETTSWTSTDQTVATVSPAGVVTGARAGHADIVATVGAVVSAPVTVTVTPGAAARLAIRTQPAGGASGAALTTQPAIEIRDAAGNLVVSSSATVTAVVATGGGTITGSTANAVGGVASFAALALSGTVGDRTLVFSAPGVSPVTSIGFALAPGAPAQLVVRIQPGGATANSPLITQPVVELRDGAGNLATTSSATVTAGIGNGGGSLTNATAIASKGVASFSGLTVVGSAGERTLTFSATGVPTISSASFVLLASP